VNLFAINGRDEGDVNRFIDIMGYTVRSAFCVIHFLVVFGPEAYIALIGHQLGETLRGFDYPVRVLIEHFEKIALAGQQLSKQHGELLSIKHVKKMTDI